MYDSETADQSLEEKPFHRQSVISPNAKSGSRHEVETFAHGHAEKLSYVDSVPQRRTEQLTFQTLDASK